MWDILIEALAQYPQRPDGTAILSEGGRAIESLLVALSEAHFGSIVIPNGR